MLDVVGKILHSAVSANGNGGSLNVSGFGVAAFQMSFAGGTPTVTANPEGSIDGSNWLPLLSYPVSGAAAALTHTAAGIYRCNVSALVQFRVRLSGYSGSGTITVHATAIEDGNAETAA